MLCGIEEAYNVFVTGMNRGITVAIAVYRYCLVFYPFAFIGDTFKQRLERNILNRIVFGIKRLAYKYGNQTLLLLKATVAST